MMMTYTTLLLLFILACVIHIIHSYLPTHPKTSIQRRRAASLNLFGNKKKSPQASNNNNKSSNTKSCKTCNGDGFVPCKICNGTGIDKKNGNAMERWKCKLCQGMCYDVL